MSSVFIILLVTSTCALAAYLHWYAPRASRRLREQNRNEIRGITIAARRSREALALSAELAFLAERIGCAEGLPVLLESRLFSEITRAWSGELRELALRVKRLERAATALTARQRAGSPAENRKPLGAEDIDVLLSSPALTTPFGEPAEAPVGESARAARA